jgi:hypothetical protein
VDSFEPGLETSEVERFPSNFPNNDVWNHSNQRISMSRHDLRRESQPNPMSLLFHFSPLSLLNHVDACAPILRTSELFRMI